MRISTAVLVTLALSAQYSAASEKNQKAIKEWPQEPSAILGIKLGHSVAESQLPTCVKPSASNSYALPNDLCLYPDEFNMGIQQIGGIACGEY